MNEKNERVLERDEVESLMASIFAELSLKPKSVSISSGSNKGDGYLSFMTSVDVLGEDDKELHAIIKCAPRSEQIRKFAPINDVFSREIYGYDVILPAFRRFQDRYNLTNPFKSVAKCFKTQSDNCKELLVLENIRMNGFKLWNRMKPMDAEHIELVFKTYGRYHAISYAMQRQAPEEYAELIKGCSTEVFSPNNLDQNMLTMIETMAGGLQALFEGNEEYAKLYAKLGRFKEFGLMNFWRSLANNQGEFPVILHGDCWVNNMMFRYDNADEPNIPTDICLLDLQLMKVGSPVLDLSYFLYVSAPKSMLDKLDDLLALYHGSLMTALAEMDCQKCPITLDELKREWKQFSRYGFLMSMMVSKAMMSEGDELFDFADFAEIAEEDMGELMKREGKHDEFVKQKMRALAIHLYENNFL